MEAILRRERALVAGCLGAIVLLSWLYLFDMARDMSSMSTSPDMSAMAMDMPGMDMAEMSMSRVSWRPTDLVLLFFMWSVMMVAMMVPSAAPMILVFLSVNQRRQQASRPAVAAYIFVLGYIAAWGAYSALATLAQWGLHAAALISPAMVVTSPIVTGTLLIAAGVYQWTPLKKRCLVRCRSPLEFLMTRWREGRWGAWMMGLEHGWYCVGCCWVLMALLFVTGVMNLLWVAVIAAFVITEKLVPRGELFGRATGVILAFVGVVFMARSL